MIKVFVDSGSSIKQDEKEKYDVEIIPLRYLMGDTVSDLREYLIYILENKLYTQDSIEVFNITTPSVMTSDGTVSKSVKCKI